MTIGIGCYGANAVAAVMSAVMGAELAGRGSIGGFAVLAVLDEDDAFQHTSVQRGGVSGLKILDAWQSAKTAAIISSGPDRPEPLVQFLPGQSGVGLVAGHRLPNSLNEGGVPVNRAVLQLLERGQAPQDAIDHVLNAEPEMDAGLIALSAQGVIGWANTRRVARRPDIGVATKIEADRGFALLLNSIFSNHASCAELARCLGDLAWGALNGTQEAHGFLRLDEPVALRPAEQDRVHIDVRGSIVALETANRALLSGQHAFRSVVYGAPQVLCDGKPIGHAATELYARIDEGVAYPSERLVERTMIVRRG
ncbi:hypothetical protein AC629_10465 [Bradyrhizobium sp. NAS80.1]|nr:hypothetical protein AC629_10465 [Bradyrhizobium sp. NAS80.1]